MRAKATITQIGDRVEIQTDSRRASAVLMVLSGSTLEEAGAVLGVTRERARQYLKDVGIVSKRDRVRFTDTPTQSHERFTRPIRKRMARLAKFRERRRDAVAWIRDITPLFGRSPTYGELAIYIYGRTLISNSVGPTLAHYFSRHDSSTRILRAIYRAAGVGERGVGGAGWAARPEEAYRIRSETQKRIWANMSPERLAQRLDHLQNNARAYWNRLTPEEQREHMAKMTAASAAKRAP